MYLGREIARSRTRSLINDFFNVTMMVMHQVEEEVEISPDIYRFATTLGAVAKDFGGLHLLCLPHHFTFQQVAAFTEGFTTGSRMMPEFHNN